MSHSSLSLPTLYITGHPKEYISGCLLNNKCTKEDLWDELTKICPLQSMDDIKYEEEINKNDVNVDSNCNIRFRIIMHKLKQWKNNESYPFSSNNCRYFALMRPPYNLSKTSYDKLVESLRESKKYICNKLNKRCVYISGPQYKYMDPEDLATECNQYIDISNNYKSSLEIEVIIHELDRWGIHDRDNVINSKQTPKKNNRKIEECSPLIQDHLHDDIKLMHRVEHQQSVEYVCRDEPKPKTSVFENKIDSNLKYPVFAFVWFHLRARDNNKSPNNAKRQSTYIGGTLPALSVMEGLNMMPYNDGKGVYRVEMVIYDECYQNLPLTVDRIPHYKDIGLTFLQCIFLPFAAGYPPKKLWQCFHKDFQPKSRTEHVGQQVPWDIAALWRYSPISSGNVLSEITFRIISFICASILMLIVVPGPIIYGYNYNHTTNNLLFFDCFGPIIFYGITSFTIIWWTGQTRECIPPREHELLYHQMIATIPIKQQQNDIKKRDTKILLNISDEIVSNTFLYAHFKAFFQLRTPTHVLLSTRPLKASFLRIPRICWMILFSIPHFIGQNLENFWDHHPPAYIDKNDETPYIPKLMYCIGSDLVSFLFVFCFLWLWETMFIRIERYRDNVKCLLDLLIKTHYSEAINLTKINNISSWLELQKFVKGKGMILFASLEAPLLSLWILAVFSWIGFIYCIYKGNGLKDNPMESLMSNSAWWTWLYLAILTGIETGRMVFWYGLQFVNTTKKIEQAIKSQSLTMQRNSLNQYISTNNKGTWEQKRAMKAAQNLSLNINHDQIIPNVFGIIKFDNLIATAAWSLLISAIPTVFTIIYERIK